MICACGLEMSFNPHPDAGKPAAMLDVGTTYVCIPCTVRSRHQWASRAMRAESELARIHEHQVTQVKG